MTRPRFQEYWRDQHALLAMAYADALGFARYVQSRTISDAAQLPLAAAGATLEGQRAGELLLKDERRFIDLSNSPIFLPKDIDIAD